MHFLFPNLGDDERDLLTDFLTMQALFGFVKDDDSERRIRMAGEFDDLKREFQRVTEGKLTATRQPFSSDSSCVVSSR